MLSHTVTKNMEVTIHAVKSMQSHYSYCFHPCFVRYMDNINRQLDNYYHLVEDDDAHDAQAFYIQKQLMKWCKFVREFVKENVENKQGE